MQPTLEPARALPEPGAGARGRFLVGGRIDDAGEVAEPREPHAEIGVFRHVERIPPADRAQHVGAKMVGSAAQRQRQPKVRECRQEDVEQPRIFGGEMPGQPVVTHIVDREPRLHAGKLPAAPAIGGKGKPQLIGLRLVLGVVHHEITAAREGQRRLQRLRLGARAGIGCDDDLERAVEIERLDRGKRSFVIRLADQFDVQFFARIIPALGSKCTKARFNGLNLGLHTAYPSGHSAVYGPNQRNS